MFLIILLLYKVVLNFVSSSGKLYHIREAGVINQFEEIKVLEFTSLCKVKERSWNFT